MSVQSSSINFGLSAALRCLFSFGCTALSEGFLILKLWLHIFLVMMKVFKWFCHTGGLFLIQN